MAEAGKKTKKVYNLVKQHLVDTTAILTVCNPFYAFVENVFVGMSDDLSMSSRIDGSLVNYMGMGYLFARGRDFYFKIFDLENSKNKKWHDAGYSGAFGILFSTGIYLKNGASLEETVVGSVIGGVLGAASGWPVGYGIDSFRDLTGIKSSERVPERVRNLPSKFKKSLAAMLVAASIGSMAVTYEATPPGFKGIYGYFNDFAGEFFDD